MKPTVPAALAAVALCTPLLAVALSDAPATATDSSSVAVSKAFTHRLDPVLTADSHHNELMVLGAPGTQGDLRNVIAVTRRAHGSWGRQRVLAAPRGGVAELNATMAPGGRAVVVWANAFGGNARVRVRLPGGGWSRTTVLKGLHLYGTPQIVVNSHAGAAVAADELSGSDGVAVLRDGRWRVTHYPSATTPSIAIDRSGVVYGVDATADRGGEGSPSEARLRVGGRWSHLRLIHGVSGMSQVADVVTAPNGALTIAVGYASNNWVSTLDTESYFPTAYAVLRQSSWGATPRIVWRRDGATDLQLVPSTGGAVATWTQWQQPVKRKPTRIALQQTWLTPTPSAVVQLNAQAATLQQGGYGFGTTIADAGRTYTWWRASAPRTRDSSPAHLQTVLRTGVVADKVLTGSADRRYSSAGGPSVLSNGTVAWVDRIAWTYTAAYGWLATGGRVVTGSLG